MPQTCPHRFSCKEYFSIMKFEVIGWTNGDDERFPDHEMEFESVDRAVIKALREGGYMFDGMEHQYGASGTPVLNDGTKAGYGMRAWSWTMCDALETDDQTQEASDFLKWYLDEEEMIGPLEGKAPTHIMPPLGVDTSRIVPREMLAEEFPYPLVPAAYDAVEAGKKTWEFLLNNQKARLICEDDIIIFTCGERTCRVRVTFSDNYSNAKEFFLNKAVKVDDDAEAMLHGGSFAGCDTPAALYKHYLETFPEEERTELCKEGYAELRAVSFKKM